MRLLSVVLSGGSGSRLWPVSRQALPKPFMTLGGSTLLQQAIERGQACGTGDLMVVTNKDHQFLTKDVLRQMSDPPSATYLLSPRAATRRLPSRWPPCSASASSAATR
jgi:mannose-1-phosphate guanylyltransferase/mannose-6-phosphate isomerase